MPKRLTRAFDRKHVPLSSWMRRFFFSAFKARFDAWLSAVQALAVIALLPSDHTSLILATAHLA